MGLGAVGAGIYAFFNRLLIPTGLHHALNNVFWFNLANINDIGKFWGSADPASGAVIATGGFHPFGVYVTGIYQAGFFPIMMFGLPAGALAIYKNAKPENKKATGSLMLAGAIAAFLTGVTEPLEFSFMFAAFPLYVVHALLTAISVFIAASFQWIAGFNFSAGFIDWFLSLKVPAAHMPWMLIVQGLVFAVIYYFVFDFMIRKFNMRPRAVAMTITTMPPPQRSTPRPRPPVTSTPTSPASCTPLWAVTTTSPKSRTASPVCAWVSWIPRRSTSTPSARPASPVSR